MLGILFNKKVEWINDDNLGDHLHFEFQMLALFGKNNSGHKIPKRVLLPIQKMVLWLYFK
jgi:hypothetical protein